MGTKIFIGLIALSAILVGITKFYEQESVATDETVISASGVHWHPKVAISVRGESVAIPPNIGLIGGHNPMHTHETDGTVHLEYESVVRENDTKVGRFFEVWGKEFSDNQLFENVNNENEKVRMYVNGEENFEFENYLMKDEDFVEIKFE